MIRVCFWPALHVKCLEKTFVAIGCYIKRTDLAFDLPLSSLTSDRSDPGGGRQESTIIVVNHAKLVKMAKRPITSAFTHRTGTLIFCFFIVAFDIQYLFDKLALFFWKYCPFFCDMQTNFRTFIKTRINLLVNWIDPGLSGALMFGEKKCRTQGFQRPFSC